MTRTRQRKIWLAISLSLITPGLGQLYSGDLASALGITFAWLLLSAGIKYFVSFSFTHMSVGIVAAIALSLLTVIHAARVAKQRKTAPLRRFQRVWAYILFTLIVNVVISGLEPVTKRSETFKLPASSMYPNVIAGDHIMVDRMAYKHSDPKRGDIIVFRYPKDESFYYIKRVVGIPGDTVTVTGPKVTVTGTQIAYSPLPDHELARFRTLETDVNLRNADASSYLKETLDTASYVIIYKNDSSTASESFTVPADSYFVLGDNRDFSNDSRFFGFVPRENVIGKSKFIWLHLAINEDTSPFRFLRNRIGKRLE